MPHTVFLRNNLSFPTILCPSNVIWCPSYLKPLWWILNRISSLITPSLWCFTGCLSDTWWIFFFPGMLQVSDFTVVQVIMDHKSKILQNGHLWQAVWPLAQIAGNRYCWDLPQHLLIGKARSVGPAGASDYARQSICFEWGVIVEAWICLKEILNRNRGRKDTLTPRVSLWGSLQ